MRIFLVALRKELLEQYRSYRLLVVAVLFLAFGLIAPLTAKFTPELLASLLPEGEQIAALMPPPTAASAVTEYVENVGQFGVVLALLMGMGAVAREKERGTAALMLVKPMPRWAFLWAKFAAQGLTFAVGVIFASAACYYYTLVLFERLDILRWLALNGLLLSFMLVYVALTLFCSTLSRSQVLAGGMAFGLVVLLGLLGVIPGVREVLPARLPTWGAGLMSGGGEASWPALGTSVAIVAAALVGAWAALERQEP